MCIICDQSDIPENSLVDETQQTKKITLKIFILCLIEILQKQKNWPGTKKGFEQKKRFETSSYILSIECI